MHADLIAALRAGWPIVHLVTVTLPDHTIRWMLERGFVKWGSDLYKSRDATYGVLDSISDITDGVDDDASPVSIRIIPPDLSSLAALAASDAQGGWVTIHLAAKNPATGALVNEPYRLWLGELDQPRLITGKTRKLEYDIITGDARGLQPNEEQRQTNALRKLIWPGERGDEYATEGTKWTYWREDEPRNAIGVLTGRAGDEDNKAIQFSYEPNAPLAFPIGRFGFGGTVRYRVGYGPTNRYQSLAATFGASGPIKSVLGVSFDDEATTFDSEDRATNGAHAGEMWFSYLLGDQPSAALTSPVGTNAEGSPAPGWTTDHKLSGRPAFMWTGKENSKKGEYRGGIPKVVITGEGLFGHDPRDEASDLSDPSTWPWMDEGCIAALNWTIGRWEGPSEGSPVTYGVPYACWPVGGIAAPLETIDVDAFTACADIADANGWKAGGVPFSDEDKNDVLEDLLKASGAERARKCGMISCISNGAVVSSVLTATGSDTAKPPVFSLAPSRLDRKNTGIADFLSEDHRWEQAPVEAITNPDWVEEDGGRHTEGYSYRFVPDKDQAAQLVYLEMANAREKIAADVLFKPWMMQLEPGHAFDWAEPEYLLDGVKVRVRKRTWSPSDCTVKIEFREETDAKVAAALAQTGTAPGVGTPSTPPVRHELARFPVRRTTWDETADVDFPTSATETEISILEHKAFFNNAPPEEFSAGTITGLTGGVLYGVFGKDGSTYEAEPSLALTHMLDDSWVFIGWQATPDSGGDYPEPPTPPAGWGGDGPTVSDTRGAGDAIQAVDDLVEGVSSFTTLKVGAAIIAESGALAEGIVKTPALDDGAANQVVSLTTTGGTTVVADTPTVVQSITLTVVDGEAVDLNGQYSFSQLTDSIQPFILGYWLRQGEASPVSVSVRVDGADITGAAGARRYILAPGFLSVFATDTPGAGTYTWDLYAQTPAGADDITISQRYARAVTATKP